MIYDLWYIQCRYRRLNSIRGLETHRHTACAVVNVDQDVDEPWPLEVYGHDEKATNVTMRPGDMVLYESHSVIHGRPFPLKGKLLNSIWA